MACSRSTEDGADKRTAGRCCSPPPHVITLALIATVSAGGAFLGSIYGFSSGLINKRGYKGALARAGSHAKTSAIICGVEDLVFYILRSLHAKAGDTKPVSAIIDRGISGCCTGLALSFPGTPQDLLQSCLGYGAFSIVIDWGTHELGRVSWTNNKCKPSSCAKLVLPPFTLPLPSNIKEGFSSFCESLGKNKGNGQ